MWNSDNLEEFRSSEIETHFNEIQYQVTRRRHFKDKQTNRDFGTLSLAKNRDSEKPSNKKRDFETREIRLKFCETQSFGRTVPTPTFHYRA